MPQCHADVTHACQIGFGHHQRAMHVQAVGTGTRRHALVGIRGVHLFALRAGVHRHQRNAGVAARANSRARGGCQIRSGARMRKTAPCRLFHRG